MEGYLDKWTNIVNGFQPRYVVLSQQKGMIIYFTSNDQSEITKPRGRISLKEAVVSVDDPESTGFAVVLGSNTQYRFQASDITERNQWVSRIEEVISELKSIEMNEKNKSDSQINLKSTEMYVELIKDGQKQLSETIQTDGDDTVREACKQNITKFSEIIESITNNIDNIKSVSLCEGDNIDKIDSLSEDEVSEDSFHDAIDSHNMINTQTDIQDDDGIIYDEELPDKPLDNVTINTSVIAHLVSQVKIGMDLSKITFPTFVLEPRSLLEMFCDFFSHADNFADMTSFPTQKERFIAIVKYYLASFYAGRKNTVAKKPYNPVLGEKFICLYKSEKDRLNYPYNKDGPVPWSKTCDISFIAEQVSHHPPISAFYAECPSTNVACSAHIYTKSRFLGMSAGVNNIGKGVISLINHNESYEFNFPSGYARSIFTVPWFEFGGQTQVTTSNGAFHADIEFHCKPFFNNRKHKITCSLYEGTSKTPFMEIYGEWNGIMYVGNPKDEVKTVFIDSHADRIYRKYVKSLTLQEPNESRNLWKDVTTSLLSNNIDNATAAKNKIENYQRELAKTRKDKFIPKYFSEVNEGEWVYNQHLEKRNPAKIKQ